MDINCTKEIMKTKHPSKQELLKVALEKILPCKGEDAYELIKASFYAIRSGMVWDEVITLVEAVTHDDLSGHRPRRCKCGASLYTSGLCDSYGTCENSAWVTQKVEEPVRFSN